MTYQTRRSKRFVQIEVWDHKLVKQFRGRVDVPLKQVLDNQRRSKTATGQYSCQTLLSAKLCPGGSGY